ncbi:MAG: PilZ domain-containing protein [Elusimicrobia bacterium]|nr:PilZ domain-containing protein [Elusimicrobiota bacterium]
MPKKAKSREERMFDRHEGELPIKVRFGDSNTFRNESMNNISLGGMSFRSSMYFEPGTELKVRAITLENAPEVEGKVVWCKRNRNSYNVGVEFHEPEAKFGIRLLEQLFHIENYRRQVKKEEGRDLTREEAAAEWIRKYAGTP